MPKLRAREPDLPKEVRKAVERIQEPVPRIDVTRHWDRAVWTAKWGGLIFAACMAIVFAGNLMIDAGRDRKAGYIFCGIDIKPPPESMACLGPPPALCGDMSRHEFSQAEKNQLEWIAFQDSICGRQKPQTVQAYASRFATDTLKASLALIEQEREETQRARVSQLAPRQKAYAEQDGLGGPEGNPSP